MVKTITEDMEQQAQVLLRAYKRSNEITLQENQKRYYDYLGFLTGISKGYKTNPSYEHKFSAMVGVKK
jgi:hypothetical protein|tara:strand:- start:186 stop:389 length:204 start_codon:yes stop_codon:yes gene_type:complete